MHTSHVYRKIRDPVCQDATAATPSMIPVTTNGTGLVSFVAAFAPLGIQVPTLTVTAGSLSANNTVWDAPHCPWLNNNARNFERYRVLNATLIFVGNVGSTTIGSLTVTSTTDVSDYVRGIVTPATSTGGKTVNLASASTREQRFPLDVDSSWKKVSASTLYCTNGSVQTLYPFNSFNDLLFTAIDVYVTGGPATTNVGSFYLEYDVEFKDPTSFVINA